MITGVKEEEEDGVVDGGVGFVREEREEATELRTRCIMERNFERWGGRGPGLKGR